MRGRQGEQETVHIDVSCFPINKELGVVGSRLFHFLLAKVEEEEVSASEVPEGLQAMLLYRVRCGEFGLGEG
jgi:hypothetical protein